MPEFFLKLLKALSDAERERLADWLYIIDDEQIVRAVLSVVDKDSHEEQTIAVGERRPAAD